MFQFIRDMFRPVLPHHSDHGAEDETDDRTPPLIVSKDGWLEGDGIIHIPTERIQALATKQTQGMMWHWTCSRSGARDLARRIAKRPREGERAASWHLLIAREGLMYQSAPITVGTWHAGGPSARRFAYTPHSSEADWTLADEGRGKVTANALFFSVELENFGEVREVNEQWVAAGRPRQVDKAFRAWPFGGSKSAPHLGPVCPSDEVMA